MAVCILIPRGLNWLGAPEHTSLNIEIASLGGLAFLVAFWSLFLGWLLLLLGSRVATLAVGIVGLVALITVPIAVGDMTGYQTPTLWAWVVAYVILVMGGMPCSRRSAAQ